MEQLTDLKAILHSKRANIYYLEKCRVMQKDGRVLYLTEAKAENQYWNIPIANTTCLLLGTGTSITQAAMRMLAQAGVLVGFCGGGSTLWDWKVDANGQEKQLDELNSRWYRYTQQHWQGLSEQFAKSAPVVYMEDKNDHNGLHRNFIFNNEDALKRVHWRHFLADCEELKASFSEVTAIEQQELIRAENWLQETYWDIVENFDLDVVKFRKKRKVVIAPGAFDGLMDEGGDE